MRIGIMGVHYGHIGGMFQSALNAKNGDIVGLVAPDDTLYERYASQATIPRFNSLDEMLADAWRWQRQNPRGYCGDVEST